MSTPVRNLKTKRKSNALHPNPARGYDVETMLPIVSAMLATAIGNHAANCSRCRAVFMGCLSLRRKEPRRGNKGKAKK